MQVLFVSQSNFTIRWLEKEYEIEKIRIRSFLRLDVESDHIKKRESENLKCVVHCAKKKIKETKIREEEVWLHLA